jgi:hypothetical protein
MESDNYNGPGRGEGGYYFSFELWIWTRKKTFDASLDAHHVFSPTCLFLLYFLVYFANGSNIGAVETVPPWTSRSLKEEYRRHHLQTARKGGKNDKHINCASTTILCLSNDIRLWIVSADRDFLFK